MNRPVVLLLAISWICASQDNLPNRRERPEQHLKAMLALDPNDAAALMMLGALKIEDAAALREGDDRTGALDDAESTLKRAAAIDSDNIIALYNLGVVGWMRVFPELTAARARLAMDPETAPPLRDVAARAVLNGKYSTVIAESIGCLEQAVKIDPSHTGAMSYLNLLYRAKADLEENEQAAREDLAIADNWVQKAGQGPTPSPNDQVRLINPVMRISHANLRHQVPPVYPAEAKAARIQGTVRFNATIAKDGTIKNLTVLNGHPMLVPAALEAVKQWLYQPSQLNGEPVEVMTTIDVNFALDLVR